MTELTTPAYVTSHTGGNGRVMELVPEAPPLDPRTRALVIGICRVLLLAVDVLQETYDLPRRAKGKERE